MKERVRSTRSGLFTIELLIDIGVFSLCAAVCVGLFVSSELISQESTDLTRAVRLAQSAAECYKASAGDLTRTQTLIGGVWSEEESQLRVWYDEDWNPMPMDAAVSWAEAEAYGGTAEALPSYTLRLEPLADENGYAEAYLSVNSGYRELVHWRIAALNGGASVAGGPDTGGGGAA